MLISEEIKLKIREGKPNYFPNSFPKMFSWNDLEKLINLRPYVNINRCRIIADRSYSWKNQIWLSDQSTFPPTILHDELRKYHCYLSDSSRVNETVNKVCQELEEIFPYSGADAHIYFTISDILNNGLDIHWDLAHNLIVQMEGQTRFLLWDYYGEGDGSEREIDSIPVDPVHDVVLNPGDAVFIPMRAYHRAISQSKRLSISFPVVVNQSLAPQDRHWIKL